MAKKKKKRQEKSKNNKLVTILLLIGFALFIVLLIFVYTQTDKLIKGLEKESSNIEYAVKQPLLNSTQAIAYLPAVDEENKGVIVTLVVEGVRGSGRTLVDIDSLLFWSDTQHSIRIAKNVAKNITGIDVNKYDLVYNIYANASVIGGGSAGAALTLATIAALENKTLKNNVIITGTINHDGTIGPVQAILPKAKAAKAHNATTFLVPLLQSREITYETNKHCEKFGAIEYCTEEQVPKRVNISEEAGIEVIEVETIKEAMKYFFE